MSDTPYQVKIDYVTDPLDPYYGCHALTFTAQCGHKAMYYSPLEWSGDDAAYLFKHFPWCGDCVDRRQSCLRTETGACHEGL